MGNQVNVGFADWMKSCRFMYILGHVVLRYPLQTELEQYATGEEV